MAFKLAKEITLSWPVRVNVPGDGGKVTRHTFDARFKILDQREYDLALNTSIKDEEFIGKFLVGWDGLLDDDGEAIEFSADMVNELCKYPFVRLALIEAYNNAATGAIAKN